MTLYSLRTRWASFAGTFLAVALGVGLTTAMGLALAATSGAPEHLKERDSEAVFTVNAMLATAAAVTVFTSVFIVASTFAFAVAQRQREFGLLRTVGATPRQVRTAVVLEAAGVGVLASATGCVLGSFGGPRLVAWMADERLAPSWLTVGDAVWPYHLAFWSGLVVVLVGAYAASARAGRTSAVDVLREADVDKRTMTLGRWILGGGLLLTGLGLLAYKVSADPGDLLKRKTYTTQPMLLIGACALLAPLAVRPIVRLVSWLPERLPGATGMLVREGASAGVRRTAAVAAPVLVTVALAGSLLGNMQTVGAGKTDEIRDRTAADYVVTGGAGGLSPAAVRAVSGLPDSDAAVSAPAEVEYLLEGIVRVPAPGRSVDPAAHRKVAELPLIDGSLARLDDRSIIVNEEWPEHTVGAYTEVWRSDGSKVRLRIAGVMRNGTGSNGVYVTPANAPGAVPDRIDVVLADGADETAAVAGLKDAAGAHGATVRTAEQWILDSQPETKRENRLAIVVVLGLALLYALISLAGTMVMATADRVRDLRVLRLSGATGAQVLRLVAAEALTVVVAGAVLGCAVTALNLFGTWSAVAVLVGGAAPVSVPWAAIGAAVAACAVVAVPAAVLPAALLIRRQAARRA